jgi:hypothetical protein
VDISNFSVVSAVCFDGSEPTAYSGATLLEPLTAGDSAEFTTELSVEPSTCTAFAMYAVGLA